MVVFISSVAQMSIAVRVLSMLISPALIGGLVDPRVAVVSTRSLGPDEGRVELDAVANVHASTVVAQVEDEVAHQDDGSGADDEDDYPTALEAR